VLGSIFGAVFVTLLPIAIRIFMETVGVYFVEGVYLAQVIAQMRLILFGLLIILFLVVEPDGLNKLWQNIRNYFRTWPFSY
jgi:branched-chain amino acid transport system permease protein